MKKQLTSLVETLLTKGMAIMESEQAQKILTSPQAPSDMDVGPAAITKINGATASKRAGIADKLGLATRKEVEDLRAQLEQLEAAAKDEPAKDEPAKAEE